MDSDLPHLKQCLAEVVKELGLPPPASGSYVADELLAEFCRWGGSEMHAIASVMGGIASQVRTRRGAMAALTRALSLVLSRAVVLAHHLSSLSAYRRRSRQRRTSTSR